MIAYGQKTEETEEFVIYKYTNEELKQEEGMTGIFKCYKTSELKVDIIKNHFTGDTEKSVSAFRLASRAKKYFEKNGVFPEKINTYQKI